MDSETRPRLRLVTVGRTHHQRRSREPLAHLTQRRVATTRTREAIATAAAFATWCERASAELAGTDPRRRDAHRRMAPPRQPLRDLRARLVHRRRTDARRHRRPHHAPAHHTAAHRLEMETRMALVPDGWEDPRDSAAATLADDTTAPGVIDAEDIS